MRAPLIDNKQVINSKFLNEDIINLLDQTFLIPDSFNYSIFEVTEEYIARPDLISLDAYGDTSYGDVICKLNGVSNPFELNSGMKIVIPSSESIDEFIITPPMEETEQDDVIAPKPKQRHEKRKANEAIVGDNRFRIDPNTGIIIY